MVFSYVLECFHFYFLVLLLLCFTSCLLEIYDVEFIQTGVGATRTAGKISTIAGAVETARTSVGASSHPSDSQSHPCPFIFSRGGSIPVVYSLETTLGPLIAAS